MTLFQLVGNKVRGVTRTSSGTLLTFVGSRDDDHFQKYRRLNDFRILT